MHMQFYFLYNYNYMFRGIFGILFKYFIMYILIKEHYKMFNLIFFQVSLNLRFILDKKKIIIINQKFTISYHLWYRV